MAKGQAKQELEQVVKAFDKKKTTLVLLSGGVNSAALLWAYSDVAALFVNYGQPAAKQEYDAAKALCDLRGCKLRAVSVALPLANMANEAGEAGPRVVPGRNAVFLSLGFAYAAEMRCSAVAIGSHAGDWSDYPDCRPGFMSIFAWIGNSTYGVDIKAPAFNREAALLSLEKAGAAGLTWSCYAPKAGKPCGGCDSCKQTCSLT